MASINQFLGSGNAPFIIVAILAVAAIVALVVYSILDTRAVRYRFLTVGSHKLRTPLSKIGVAISELLSRQEAAVANDKPYVIEDFDERLMRQIAVEQQRLVGLVNLLLEVTESESGRMTYEKETFDLVLLIREVLVGYQNSGWRNDRVFIDFESTVKSVMITADRKRISSVLQVLLENAITYSPSGGKVLVLLEATKRHVTVSVSDKGIGLTSEEKRRIFSKFYRSTRAMRIDTEGTGVGLFLARHIVEGHHGKMGFESDGELKGSVFYFTLPRKI